MGRTVPRPVRRELRQEVNFGCAICGNPLVEFHHIIRWEDEEHYDPDHMIALCPNHHRFANDGAITKDELYDAKEDPSNAEIVDYEFYFDPESPVIPLGSVLVELASEGEYTLIQIHDEPIFKVKYTDGRIEFDVNFYNEEDELISVITDNEWWANTDKFWDIKYQSNRLKLWNEKYEIGFVAEYVPDAGRVSFRGIFLREGEKLIIHPSKIKFGGANTSFIQTLGIIVGGNEDYNPRIMNDVPGGFNYTGPAEGVFAIGGDSDEFAIQIPSEED